MTPFPSLAGFEPTRQTLHNYAQAIGVIARLHGNTHPRFWHISLRVTPQGLTSSNIPLPDGGILSSQLNLQTHEVVIETSHGQRRTQSMTAGLTGSQMGDWVIATANEFGLMGNFDRAKFESDASRPYDADRVGRFFQALISADRVLHTQKAKLGIRTTPVQHWPHGFDIALEWVGTRIESYEENGKVEALPAQLNFGFYPGSQGVDPYFYSNPWPFESEILLHQALPAGASWHTDGWLGTFLPYSELAGTADGAERLLEFYQAVFDIASPTLTAK